MYRERKREKTDGEVKGICSSGQAVQTSSFVLSAQHARMSFCLPLKGQCLKARKIFLRIFY